MLVRSLRLSLRIGWLFGMATGTLVLACLPLLAGPLTGEAADTGTSQCVVCHTDAAKLKALTPPDPPPSEEGEG
jgi:mono/diheme cytochrome c family protein